MKEAFWGILIVMLGLLGIVIVNIFQNVTVGNDRTYYQLKESAEAAAYDALDLSYYRLNGDIRMIEDKFVENFTRRFAQNIGSNGNFNITVQEITGNPPRISIKVSTGITSLQGDDFGIVNRTDGIIESKYKIGEITGFLGITEEEWLARINANGEKDNACNITTYGSEELECIPGDLEFTGWGDVNIPAAVCDAGDFKPEKRDANYRVCECGKWKNEIAEVTAIPKHIGDEYRYNWSFKKTGEIRDIDERAVTRSYVEICTDAIEIYVPKNLNISDKILDPKKYELCPASGTIVNLGQTRWWRANYIPSNSNNRKITWSKPDTDKTILIDVDNPLTDKGYSYLKVEGKELGTTTVTAISTNKKTATCNVTVLDGYADSVSCVSKTISVGDEESMEGGYLPKTATNTKLTWSISDSSIASINDKGIVKGKKKGNATVTVKSKNLYDNTEVSFDCKLKVTPPSGSYTGGPCNCTVWDIVKYEKQSVCKGTEYSCTKYGYMGIPYTTTCCTYPGYKTEDVPVYGNETKTGTTLYQYEPSAIYDGQCYEQSFCTGTKDDGNKYKISIGFRYYSC